MSSVDWIVAANLVIGGLNLLNAHANMENSKKFIQNLVGLRKIAENMQKHINDHVLGVDNCVNPHGGGTKP